MNGTTPNCLDDFLFSTPADKRKLEFILANCLSHLGVRRAFCCMELGVQESPRWQSYCLN